MLQQDLFSSVNNKKIVFDLFQAYYNARRNKRNTINALAFEKNLETNLFYLLFCAVYRDYLHKYLMFIQLEQVIGSQFHQDCK